MEKTEFDLVRELYKYTYKYAITTDDLLNAIETVEDLLSMFIKDTQINEPNATKSIESFIKAKDEVTKMYHEVADLLE